METIKATRDELLRTRQELAIAQSGKQILEKKKEALLNRFLGMVRQYKGKREALLAEIRHLKDLLALAQARDGLVTIRSLALATSQDISLEITRDNVMGTKIFHAKHPDVKRDILSRGYNPVSTSGRIESCAELAERLLDRMLAIAHLEHNIKTVGREMRSLNSKINALEENIIPRLRAKKRYIEDTLEQFEREEIFRLKMVKRVQEKKTEEATPTAQRA
ncbi:MAG: V-type ATP synthase subunit D [Candidatus Bipolaricaulota bacterium]|nr:V-type ATP synthase subunit D [Candidatus Bipolaricaulota bacterium]MCS7275151.1 V-type ATP synthase subunit D [Candidatus Bipolaricaulota bacterium]MDW8111604.1 V-type ATP synthase subunit D [Candidatus Bipolaricaulota bacterium]MDW8329691.1 V-type ATP synthase subunit D [Candidatus Bipolaricaulota bacterium]